MDGCEASSQIRASSKADATTIPIIACTANAFTEDIAATQSAGMNAHVSKPLDFSVLEHVLAKVIASRSDLEHLVALHPHILKNANSTTISAPIAAASPNAMDKAQEEETKKSQDNQETNDSKPSQAAPSLSPSAAPAVQEAKAAPQAAPSAYSVQTSKEPEPHSAAAGTGVSQGQSTIELKSPTRISNDAKPPVVPITPAKVSKDNQGSEDQDKVQDTDAAHPPAQEGPSDFVSAYMAKKDSQAAVEPKVQLSEKPKSSTFGSLDESKLKMKRADEQKDFDYSHLGDNGTYTLFKRKNKKKIDAHSLLNEPDKKK